MITRRERWSNVEVKPSVFRGTSYAAMHQKSGGHNQLWWWVMRQYGKHSGTQEIWHCWVILGKVLMLILTEIMTTWSAPKLIRFPKDIGNKSKSVKQIKSVYQHPEIHSHKNLYQRLILRTLKKSMKVIHKTKYLMHVNNHTKMILQRTLLTRWSRATRVCMSTSRVSAAFRACSSTSSRAFGSIGGTSSGLWV